jgi:hypothetical protein
VALRLPHLTDLQLNNCAELATLLLDCPALERLSLQVWADACLLFILRSRFHLRCRVLLQPFLRSRLHLRSGFFAAFLLLWWL